MTSATTSPTATPPSAVPTKSSPTPQIETAELVAAIAVRSATSAVASLTRPSPSRTVTIRRGIPTRRATAVAATASGGATTAPTATATANGTGSSHQMTKRGGERGRQDQTDRELRDRQPVTTKVDQRRAQRRRVEQGGQEADEHDVGSSAERVGTPGTNEAARPTSVRLSGAG